MRTNDQAVVIHVVEDDPALRRALQSSLSDLASRVEAWDSAEAFLGGRAQGRPGCLVLDLVLGGMSGLDLLERLPQEDPLRVVMLTAHGDVSTAVRALRRGVVDVLEKPPDDRLLRSRVQVALRESQGKVEQAATTERVRTRLSTLTPAEREVLRRLLQGKTTHEIADQMHRSERTIGNHRQRILRKMGAHNTATLFNAIVSAGPLAASLFSAPSDN